VIDDFALAAAKSGIAENFLEQSERGGHGRCGLWRVLGERLVRLDSN
jgi:hypothetical protein